MRFVVRMALNLVAAACLTAAAAEPGWEQALARWPDMRRPIAFLGCKDHPDEFGVMWNGNLSLRSPTLTAADRKLFGSRRDDALQVSFSVGNKPDFANRDADDGSTEPSLLDGYLPIARIRLNRGGVQLIEEAFVAGAEGNCAGLEWDAPVFLRVRFTVEQAAPDKGPVRLWAQFARNHTSYAMSTRRNVRIQPVAPLYSRPLHVAANGLLDSRNLTVLASNQPFRFHEQLPEALSSIALHEWQMDRNVAEFEIPGQQGAGVELILPFLPASEALIAGARRLSHQAAREAVKRCWNNEIGRGMQVQVPEQALNNIWRFTVPLSFMTADRYPNGDRVLKTSSHHYEAYWPTPMSMNVVDLAARGYGEAVTAYLTPFLDKERYRPVPNTGASFYSTRGFISGPGEHLLISWVGDHGAILWAASEYYLLTRDQRFLERWLPAMLEGLEWIAREREYTRVRGGPAAGLMPAGRGTDDERQANFVWVDAWIYRGLESVCRVLSATGHRDAARWARERDDYRATFQKALRAQIQRTFTWTDRTGERIPFVPWELSQTNADNLHIFYLDGGPMFLGVAGLEDPDADTMTWAMKWLNEGPDAGTASPDWSDFSDRPSLRFEMSSVEPCYSWNVFLRFLRNEREKFLEGFYSLAAGAVSRRFLGGSEHRDGIQNLPVMNAVVCTHLRNMLLRENGRGLELLRNAPSSWFLPGREIRVSGGETYFGAAGYHLKSVSARRMEAEIDTPARERPAWIRLHLFHPEGRALRSATSNGAAARVLSATALEIPDPPGKLKIVAEF